MRKCRWSAAVPRPTDVWRSGPGVTRSGHVSGGHEDRTPDPLGYAGPSAAVLSITRIRNFSIISHVDHGKSTLSDRILELTGAVDPRLMREQYLDSMDIERERGITIKAQNVRVSWSGHTLHLIDTPGHVDFGYEVSRSLAACEGAVLLVDASQGIQAQTLANCYQAVENDLEIVAVLNKIDLPAADPERCAAEIEQVLGIAASSILHISAKTGQGVPELLDAIVERIPAPTGDPDARCGPHLRFRLRPVPGRGQLHPGDGRDLTGEDKLRFMQAGANHEIEEIGVRTPVPVPVDALGPGEVGYLIAGIKDVGGARSGETVTTARHPAPPPWPAIATPSPWCSVGCSPSTATSCPTCATPWRSSGSTTPASPSSRSRPGLSASDSGAASSASCTWRSCASASSGSSTSR
jgi:GTP-binding protein LepA